jgi:hypothetical protein
MLCFSFASVFATIRKSTAMLCFFFLPICSVSLLETVTFAFQYQIVGIGREEKEKGKN